MSVYAQIPDTGADVEKLAERIRRKFVEAKKRQSGVVKYQLQPRYVSIDNWERAARQCITYAVSPVTYIDCLFNYNTVPRGPFPNQVGGKAMEHHLARYIESNGSPEKEWADRMGHTLSFMKEVEVNSGGKMTPFVLLRHPAYVSGFDPVIACCLMPIPQITEIYGQAALSVVDVNPAVIEALRKNKFNLEWIAMERQRTRDEHRTRLSQIEHNNV